MSFRRSSCSTSWKRCSAFAAHSDDQFTHFHITNRQIDLHEAIDLLERDDVVRDAIGTHIYERFVEAKRAEWQEYIGKVSEWELERYLSVY